MELKLLNQEDDSESLTVNQINSENRISKILADSRKNEPAPKKTPATAEKNNTKTQVAKKKEPEKAAKKETTQKNPPTAEKTKQTVAASKAQEPKKTAPVKKEANIAKATTPKKQVKVAETTNKVKPTQPNNATKLADSSNSANTKTPTPTSESTITTLSDADLNRLIFYFKRSYESGDINIFGSLFTEDAITNESENRSQIVRDYDALFEVTNKRSINLKNLTWSKDGLIANGSGTFVLSIVEKEGMAPEEIRGEINIKAEKIDHKAQIKELFYRYSFAAN